MTRQRAKPADQTSLGTPGTTETAGSTAQSASGLTGNPAVCYRPRRSRVHLGNVGQQLFERSLTIGEDTWAKRMTEIPLKTFISALSKPSHSPLPGGRLAVAAKPDPFVAPTLQIRGQKAVQPFSAEVIFVEAAAAVGKSTTANHVSALLEIPMLDLAKVPVSTGSLRALILDLSGSGNPVDAFHSARLPIFVDGLDEGRLLSGETGFESFLQTTAELLLQNRNVKDRAKMVIFGRFESTEFAKLWLELAGSEITMGSVEIGFFGKDSAFKLIDAYAQARATSGAAYWNHQEPVRTLIETYFDSIEGALGLEKGTLWETRRGRAFAGYAPVLAAVGSLLAEMDNFIEMANRLKDVGTHEAWEVIETVLDEILAREQRKLCEKLRPQIADSLPSEAYDVNEQLTILTQYVHKQPLQGLGRVRLAGQDLLKYETMVNQNIADHPFVRHGGFANTVLGSVVLAHAVDQDLLQSTGLQLLAEHSQQPFIWRSLSRHLKRHSLIDGAYVGYILNSYWNDPLTADCKVLIRSTNEDGSANVLVPADGGQDVNFKITLPMTLYRQVRTCDIDVSDTVRLEGHTLPGTRSVFYVRGNPIVICDVLDVIADNVAFDGKVWLEAQEVKSQPRLELRLQNGAQVGWGDQLANTYPWNRTPATLDAPYHTSHDDPLDDLVEECWQRLPDSGALTLNADLSVPDNDKRMRWVVKRFPEKFARLIELMINSGLASSEPMPASGKAKLRVHFKFSWGQLREALRHPETEGKLQTFVTDARHRITS